MQVNFSNINLEKKCYKPTFSAAANVRGAVINNKFYGSYQRDTLHDIADAFIYDLYGNALSNKVMQKVEKYFPDFKNNRYIKIVRNGFRSKCVVLLSADDARKHHQIYMSDIPVETKKKKGANFVDKMLKNNGQNIYIQAEKRGKRYIITDILDSSEADRFRLSYEKSAKDCIR